MASESVRTIREDWFIKEVSDRDRKGWKDIYYGDRGARKHGHVVDRGGEDSYSRTPNGTVILDSDERRK